MVAADWYFAGVRDPVEAAEWYRLRKSPRVLRTWRDSGFADVGEILGWVRLGQTIEVAKRWGEVGYGNPQDAAKWISLGQTPDSLLEWLRLGVEAREELEALCGEGLTPPLVRGLDVKVAPPEGWRRWVELTTQGQPADPKVVNEWLVASQPITEAAPWVNVGATPFERDLLLSNGVSLEMLEKLKVSRCYELARSVRTRHLDLEEWIMNGFIYDEMMPWKQLHMTLGEVLKWRSLEVSGEMAQWLVSLGFSPEEYLEHLSNPLISEANLKRWDHAGLPQHSVKVFVLGGIPDPDTARKWLEGFWHDPRRAVAWYKAYGGDYRRARAAQRQDERVQQSPLVSSGNPSQQSAARTDPPGLNLPQVSTEWLEEIVAWARTLQSRLRKLIQSPSIVHLEQLNLEIRIEFADDLIWGRVLAGKQSFTCAFDPDSLDPAVAPNSARERFVFGVCLCWFIDCSIVLPRLAGTSPDLYRVDNSQTRGGRTGVRYVPTTTFQNRRRERIDNGVGDLKIRHQVSGHIRALPAGNKGSIEARSSAPKHIQKVMKRNETYVQPHFRGTEEQKREIETRLSRYSALGEATAEFC